MAIATGLAINKFYPNSNSHIISTNNENKTHYYLETTFDDINKKFIIDPTYKQFLNQSKYNPFNDKYATTLFEVYSPFFVGTKIDLVNHIKFLSDLSQNVYGHHTRENGGFDYGHIIKHWNNNRQFIPELDGYIDKCNPLFSPHLVDLCLEPENVLENDIFMI